MIIKKMLIKTNSFARVLGEIFLEEKDDFIKPGLSTKTIIYDPTESEELFSDDLPIRINKKSKLVFFLTVEEFDAFIKEINLYLSRPVSTRKFIAKIDNPFTGSKGEFEF